MFCLDPSQNYFLSPHGCFWESTCRRIKFFGPFWVPPWIFKGSKKLTKIAKTSPRTPGLVSPDHTRSQLLPQRPPWVPQASFSDGFGKVLDGFLMNFQWFWVAFEWIVESFCWSLAAIVASLDRVGLSFWHLFFLTFDSILVRFSIKFAWVLSSARFGLGAIASRRRQLFV